MKLSMLAVVVAVALVGCGSKSKKYSGSSSPTSTIRCMWSDGSCDEIQGTMTDTERSAESSACTGSGGAFALGACSRTGTLSGSCYYANQEPVTGVHLAATAALTEYYSTSGWTTPDAQSWCATAPAGVWQP